MNQDEVIYGVEDIARIRRSMIYKKGVALRTKHPGLQELADNIIEAQEKYEEYLALVWVE